MSFPTLVDLADDAIEVLSKTADDFELQAFAQGTIEIDIVRRRFVGINGELFCRVVAEITGWDVVHLEGRDGAPPRHALFAAGGKLVDASGYLSPPISFVRDHEQSLMPKSVPVSENGLSNQDRLCVVQALHYFPYQPFCTAAFLSALGQYGARFADWYDDLPRPFDEPQGSDTRVGVLSTLIDQRCLDVVRGVLSSGDVGNAVARYSDDDWPAKSALLIAPDLLQELLAVGADPTERSDSTGENLLAECIKQCSFKDKEERGSLLSAFRALIDAGADYKAATGAGGLPALHLAAQYDVPEIIMLLVENGEPVDDGSYAGWQPSPTALWLAALAGSLASVVTLCEMGADVNTPFNGRSLLMTVVDECDEPLLVVKALVEQGADVMAVDDCGQRAIDIATDPDVVTLLQSVHAKRAMTSLERQATLSTSR